MNSLSLLFAISAVFGWLALMESTYRKHGLFPCCVLTAVLLWFFGGLTHMGKLTPFSWTNRPRPPYSEVVVAVGTWTVGLLVLNWLFNRLTAVADADTSGQRKVR